MTDKARALKTLIEILFKYRLGPKATREIEVAIITLLNEKTAPTSSTTIDMPKDEGQWGVSKMDDPELREEQIKISKMYQKGADKIAKSCKCESNEAGRVISVKRDENDRLRCTECGREF